MGDSVTLEPAAPFSIETEGAFAGAIDGENLMAKACRLALEAQPSLTIGKIRLTKRLPVAAGLGGGSADAAAALRTLMRAGLAISPAELRGIAARLGADVTVCLDQRASLMWGIGEKVAPVPALPAFWMVLANPGVPLVTADVFRALRALLVSSQVAQPEFPGSFASLADLIAWLRVRGNDLQLPAIGLCPAIAEVVTALHAAPGCLHAAQSGSGPTCFGIFASEAAARAAARHLAADRPHWWLAAAAGCGTSLHDDQNMSANRVL